MADKKQNSSEKVSVAKRLKENNQIETFRSVLHRVSKESLIINDAEGRLVVFDAVGKKYTNNIEILFDSDPEPSIKMTLQKQVRTMLKPIIALLRDKDLQLKDPETGKSYSGAMIREKNKFEIDSHLDFCTRYLVQADILLDESCDVDSRLDAAYQLGDISRCMKVATIYGKTQKKIAKQERKKGLTVIFEQLKMMKNAGLKPKELWPEFVSMLQDENRSFENVLENVGNPANCKTWSVSFSIIPDKDDGVYKDEVMRYQRFLRRLNEK